MSIIIKGIVSLVLGICFGVFLAGRHVHVLLILSGFIWVIGIVWAFPSHCRWVGKVLRPAMELSVVTYLSFGSGFLGFLLLVAVVVFNLVAGWTYGVYLLTTDVVQFVKNACGLKQ